MYEGGDNFFPTPLSPVRRTFASDRAASLISSCKCRLAAELPIKISPDTTRPISGCVVHSCPHGQGARTTTPGKLKPSQPIFPADLSVCCAKEISATCRTTQADFCLRSDIRTGIVVNKVTRHGDSPTAPGAQCFAPNGFKIGTRFARTAQVADALFSLRAARPPETLTRVFDRQCHQGAAARDVAGVYRGCQLSGRRPGI